jgi:iron(III) transport system permease protein
MTVFLILFLEKKQRGADRFYSPVQLERPMLKTRLHGVKKWLAVLACTIPVMLGFIFPLVQLVLWGIYARTTAHIDFFQTTVNSFLLALGAAISCVAVSLLLLFVGRMKKGRAYHGLMKLSTMGYAIPGAVVAIGVLVPFLFIDKGLIRILESIGAASPGLILTGTVMGLLFAFTVRFLAVGFNPVEAGFEKINQSVDDAANILQAGHWRRLFRVNIPLLRGALGTALLLVFVDILKELPLTLILRPFNFHTLATRSFELASDEQLASAAVPSLVIILAGTIPVYLLNTLITKKERNEPG